MLSMKLEKKDIYPEMIDNSSSYFSKVPYILEMELDEALSANGYGEVKVDGQLLAKGEYIFIKNKHLLMVPIGDLVKDYDRDYTVEFTGFIGESGEPFYDQTINIHTKPRRLQDKKHKDHDNETLKAAREGIILLKNEDSVLPLPEHSVLNCFGIGQHGFRICVSGASTINPRFRPTFMEAIKEYSNFSVNTKLAEFYGRVDASAPSKEMLLQAKELCDTALIFITRHTGEMQDNRSVKGQYYLSDQELDMINAVTSVFDKTIAILNIGHPIELTWLEKYNIKGVIYTGFGGMLGSYAFVETLDGRNNPSGHLPITLTWEYEDNPVNTNFPTLGKEEMLPDEYDYGVQVVYAEDIYMGYRYFDTFHKTVAFPFGHGLSYTRFEKKLISFEQNSTGVEIDIQVENVGAFSGKDVVQIYVSAPEGKLEKPGHVLCGFEKTKELKPQEKETVHVSVNYLDMASFDTNASEYVLEKGDYQFFAGSSVTCIEAIGTIILEKNKVILKTDSFCAPVSNIDVLSGGNPEVKAQSKIVETGRQIEEKAVRVEYIPEEIQDYEGKITWQQVIDNPNLLYNFIGQLSIDELCTLNVNRGPEWGLGQSGVAGTTGELKEYGLKPVRVSDANAGWNIIKPNIGFPCSSTIAATFNKDIAYTVGRVIAEEGKELAIAMNLGPGMNLERATLNGRNAEYFSEDPYLAGIMAGYHGKGLEENGVTSCYKHMFCNNAELCRKASHSIVPERALRELYFKAFEVAFRVHKPSTVMTSYNALNGIYPAENVQLLQGLLRDEWGFDGFIMTDWDSYDTIDVVEIVKAGTSWVSSGGTKYVEILKNAVNDGKLSKAVLQNNARYLLKVLIKVYRNQMKAD